MKAPFLILLLTVFLNKPLSYGQCPTGDFTLPGSVCLEENLSIKNLSVEENTNHFWDFCSGDFDVNPGANVFLNSTSVSSPFEIETVKNNGNFYGFVSSRGLKKLIRLEFGTSLLNTPKIVDLGDLGLNSNQLLTVRIVKEGLIWYGFIIDFNASKLYRLTFGEDLLSTPSVKDLGDFTTIKNPTGLEIVKHNGNNFAFISNYSNDKVAVVSFGSSLLNIPTSHSITLTGASQVGGIRVIQDNCSWFGLATSRGNGKVYKINFGSELSNLSPIVSELVLGITVPSPSGIVLAFDGGNYYSFIQSNTTSGQLTKLNFGSSLTNSPTATNLGNLSVLEANWGLSLFKDESKWFGFSSNNSGNKITRLDFSNICSSSIKSSTRSKIDSVHFTKAGTYNISLTVTDNLGNLKRVNKALSVTSSNAPKISIKQIEYCQTSSIQFMANNLTTDQTITSYSWDFGDGSTATGQNPNHQYAAAGTYKVKLSVVSENGCKNFIEKDVKIYPEPAPDFEIPAGNVCTNGEASFTNTTPGEYDGIMTWQWDFGDGKTSTEKNPVHVYTTGGIKTVTLTANIPGCSIGKSYDLEILSGPNVDFSAVNLCQGDEVNFTNLSSGDNISSYKWDFGNGYTSTLQHPKVFYETSGTYNVSLTVKNTLGCENVLVKPITIHALPVTNFINELACSGGPVQFLDRSTVANANIESWKWTIEDKVYNVKDPIHTFSQSGSFPVKLTVTSNFGCFSSTTKNIEVLKAPEADFATQPGCIGSITSFTDTSIDHDQSGINEWYWIIDNKEYFVQNPEYLFTVAGTYDVQLTITSGSFCQSTVVKQVTINPVPEAEYTYTAACVGDPTYFKEEVLIEGDDQVIEWKWNFDNVATSDSKEPNFTFTTGGNHTVSLEVTTERGCTASISKDIMVNEVPLSSFITPILLGTPPLTIEFENTSTGATSYKWFFGDALQTTSEEAHPNFTFNDLGSYEVVLIATNDFGCQDTSRVGINILDPVVDVSADQINVISQDDLWQVVVKITNKGTLPIHNMDVLIDLGNQFALKEPFHGTINPMETVNHPLNMEILKKSFSKIPFICVELVIKDIPFSENDFTNNEACLNMISEFSFLGFSPNPTLGELNISMLLPEKDNVSFSIHNNVGSVLLHKEITNTKSGFNEFQLDLGTLSKGIYHLVTTYQGKKTIQKILKN